MLLSFTVPSVPSGAKLLPLGEEAATQNGGISGGIFDPYSPIELAFMRGMA